MNLHLNKYGTRIKIDNGQFKIRQEEEPWETVNPSQVNRIYLNRGVSLSSDVMYLAIERGIPVILKSRQGKVIGRMWSAAYGSIVTIRKKQLTFSEGNDAALWICDMVNQKILNQQLFLLVFEARNPEEEKTLEKARGKLERYRRNVQGLSDKPLNEVKTKIIGLEGSAARIYFQTISDFLPMLYRFNERSRRPAKDMFNAGLNYLYGMLYGLIEGFLIEVGLDPYLGVLHRNDYNKPVLVYDIIERYRVWADAVMVRLCRQRLIFEDFFDRRAEAWLLNEFGRKLLIHAFGDYLAEDIEFKGLRTSREKHIAQYCQKLATAIRNDKISELCSI